MADIAMKPADVEAIDWLKPGSPQHSHVVEMLKSRLEYSERRMSSFYSRWRLNEMSLQAYITSNDFDAMLKDQQQSRDGSGPGLPTQINVPFAWATINTIVTYLLHMFAGRKPIFQVSSYRAEQVERAKNMEMFLQYNADYTRLLRSIYFFLMDGETYGVAVMRNMWRQDTKTRTIIVPPSPELVELGSAFGQTVSGSRERQSYVSFEGNDTANIDPFMFFPDPRVPMHEVNEKGEFVFWRAFEGRHILLKEQAQGRIKNVGSITNEAPMAYTNENAASSARGLRALGTAIPGDPTMNGEFKMKPNIQLDQGSVEIVPKDWGLGDSETPEKWLFTMANKAVIVQAEKLDLPHNRHPIVVAEPNSVGYSFGQLGTVDMIQPMQSLMSWFLNSHIYNVRAALNNQFVVDPTKVEMQDLKNPTPGGVIRLKNTAFGLTDPKSAVYQLEVTDITRSHLSDYQLFGRLAGDMSGAADNLRGMQDSGGRKTATEIRTASDAGTSRLAAKGTLYSAMAFTDLASQQSLNAQEFLTQEFELGVLGEAAQGASIRITPDSLAGDFTFPVHDGSMPMDKFAMLEVWKEIFTAVLTDQQLRSGYDIFSMFDWIAQLGGAQNIKSFRMMQGQGPAIPQVPLNMVGQEEQAAAIGSGAGIPLAEAAAMMAA
jgi:hypothetical protein